MRSVGPVVLACLTLTGSACASPPSAGPAAAEPAPVRDPESEAPAEVRLLAVGGCDERAVNDQLKEIAPRGLPWTYLVVGDAEAQCEERRVIVRLGPGATVLLGSIADDAGGSTMSRFGPELVRALARDTQRVDANAALSNERPAKLGEESLSGYCGRVDLTADGKPLVTHTCAAWKTQEGASHFVAVSLTDTEASFEKVGMSVEELIGGLVDGLATE